MTAPTIESFTARVPVGSLTTYGIFLGFEDDKATFKGRMKTGFKDVLEVALNAKLIGGDFTLDKVQVTTPEQVAQRNKESMEAVSAFYEARPDLLID
jgi:hypothetical protein